MGTSMSLTNRENSNEHESWGPQAMPHEPHSWGNNQPWESSYQQQVNADETAIPPPPENAPQQHQQQQQQPQQLPQQHPQQLLQQYPQQYLQQHSQPLAQQPQQEHQQQYQFTGLGERSTFADGASFSDGPQIVPTYPVDPTTTQQPSDLS